MEGGVCVCMGGGEVGSGDSKRNETFNLGHVEYKVWKISKRFYVDLDLRKEYETRETDLEAITIPVQIKGSKMIMENALIYLFLASIPFSENKLHTFSRDQVIPHKSNNVAIIFKNEY